MRVEKHSEVNGYTICSYRDSHWGGRKFFVQWMDGEYLTQEAAEDAARAGDLRDYADRPELSAAPNRESARGPVELSSGHRGEQG